MVLHFFFLFLFSPSLEEDDVFDGKGLEVMARFSLPWLYARREESYLQLPPPLFLEPS